jgi:hypothetical protein
MLEFSSIAAYDSTITALENQINSHDDSFLAQYASLDEEAVNAKEVEVGFVYQQPLIDFENSYKITNSMRQVFVAEEANWLNNEILDLATDPSNIYVFDIAEMSLLNEKGEVKIGNSLLKLTKGGFIEITDGDINILIRIDNGDMSALAEPNVVTNIDEASRSGDCAWWKGKDFGHEYVTGSKKVIKHVHFHAYPWEGVSEAEITSYKKSGSKWVKYRINLGVANQSYFMNNECNTTLAQEWSGWKRKNAKSISKRVVFWHAFPQYRAENGQSVTGYFEYDSYGNYLVLTW